MPLVVDASVTLSWCFRDEHSEDAVRILRLLTVDAAVVPSLWPLEVANGLLVAERRGRLSADETMQVREMLVDLPITLDEATFDEGFGSVLNLARERNLSAYDAAYLALAMREGLPLATLDDKLRAAATSVGVQLA